MNRYSSGMTISDLINHLSAIQSRLTDEKEKEAIYVAVSSIKDHVLLKARLKEMVRTHPDLREVKPVHAIQKDLLCEQG